MTSSGITWRTIWEQRRQALVAIFMFGFWAGGYFLIGRYTNVSEAVEFTTWLDSRIPFKPTFVWFYLTIYMVFLIPFVLVRESRFFREVSYAYITLMLICYSVFLIYPVVMHRPSLEVTDFSTWALSKVYGNDPPVNCFPSMHVAMAMLASLVVFEINRPQGTFLILLTFFIAASTLLTKQHYIADVLVGLLLAIAVYYIYFKQKIIDTLSEEVDRLEERMDLRVETYLEPIVRRIVAEELERMLQDRGRSEREGRGRNAEATSRGDADKT